MGEVFIVERYGGGIKKFDSINDLVGEMRIVSHVDERVITSKNLATPFLHVVSATKPVSCQNLPVYHCMIANYLCLGDK